MWKLIFIMILSLYLLSKAALVLSRFMGMGRQQQPPPFRRPADGSIHVDGNGKEPPKRGGIKGGDYVDYEEVK